MMVKSTHEAQKSDLGVRTLSAIVMLGIAGTAIWLGGWVFSIFVAIAGLAVLFEWQGLVKRFAGSMVSHALWNGTGILYIGLAAFALIYIAGDTRYGLTGLLVWIGMVIATDIGAYFAGRMVGGPKIAPKISPSKTWSGLLGGMLGASLVALIPMIALSYERAGTASIDWLPALVAGCLVAITAQCGDFFESWMKRRAGVKDSGRLIPGHGGLFDRVDGLLAVMAIGGLLSIWEIWNRT